MERGNKIPPLRLPSHSPKFFIDLRNLAQFLWKFLEVVQDCFSFISDENDFAFLMMRYRDFISN